VHQTVGTDEFCINHICALFLAEFAKGRVAYVLHLGKEDREIPEVNVANSDVSFIFIVNFRH
jgi:hypothetical protein